MKRKKYLDDLDLNLSDDDDDDEGRSGAHNVNDGSTFFVVSICSFLLNLIAFIKCQHVSCKKCIV